MIYDWDPLKNLSNIKKHGISFADAVVIFEDPYGREIPDVYFFETRIVRIGMNPYKGILVVVYCERREDLVRIISARRATKRESAIYEEGI